MCLWISSCVSHVIKSKSALSEHPTTTQHHCSDIFHQDYFQFTRGMPAFSDTGTSAWWRQIWVVDNMMYLSLIISLLSHLSLGKAHYTLTLLPLRWVLSQERFCPTIRKICSHTYKPQLRLKLDTTQSKTWTQDLASNLKGSSFSHLLKFSSHLSSHLLKFSSFPLTVFLSLRTSE